MLLRTKFRPYVSERDSRSYVALLRRLATIVPEPPLIAGLTPDPGDDYLVALARAGGAWALVSGDRHLFGLIDPKPPLLKPREFIERLTPPT